MGVSLNHQSRCSQWLITGTEANCSQMFFKIRVSSRNVSISRENTCAGKTLVLDTSVFCEIWDILKNNFYKTSPVATSLIKILSNNYNVTFLKETSKQLKVVKLFSQNSFIKGIFPVLRFFKTTKKKK